MRKRLWSVVITAALAVATTVTLSTSSAVAQPAAIAPTTWHHPGVLVNQAQLAYVKGQIAAGAQPWTSAYAAAKSSSLASLSYTPAPVKQVQCGSNSNPDVGCKAEQGDASAAWTDALLWYFSGNQAYANKAIQIMNAWSSTLTGGHTLSNGPVESGWTGSTWAEAAELIRYSNAGWSAAGIAAFQDMLAKQYVPILLTGGPPCFNGNWELVIAEALMNISVFNENASWFNTAVSYWADRLPAYVYLSSDGSTPHMPLVPNKCTQYTANQFWVQTKYVTGLAQETSRDFHHTFWGLGAATDLAETALQQGVNLYGANLYPQNATRLVDAYEWANAINNGGKAPSGIKVGPIGGNSYSMEVAYNEFHNRLGIAMPQTLAQLNKVRPTGNDTHFLEWETLTDAGVGSIGLPAPGTATGP
ncbi:MAG TPA: alginate lyase family protein [Pseudonocardiaceae bacterium]